VEPVIYTVWRRGRSLVDLGLGARNWRQAAGLGLILGAVQFFLTLYGYDLPAPVDWVALLTMSLMVGLFEAMNAASTAGNHLQRLPRTDRREDADPALERRLGIEA
jgi:hypothetical protein